MNKKPNLTWFLLIAIALLTVLVAYAHSVEKQKLNKILEHQQIFLDLLE